MLDLRNLSYLAYLHSDKRRVMIFTVWGCSACRSLWGNLAATLQYLKKFDEKQGEQLFKQGDSDIRGNSFKIKEERFR